MGRLDHRVSSPSAEGPDCEYRHWYVGGTPSAWEPSDDPSQCEVDTRVGGTSLYNDQWLEVKLPIADDYTCTGCWWSIEYVASGDATFFERTVWEAEIVGDPVRLLE